jgi:arylsulfatase A-like enzyme
MLTGRYPTTTGVLDNDTWFGANHPDWKTLPRWFKDHGYKVARSGKVFHGGIDDADAWTEGGEKRAFEGAVRKRSRGPGRKSDLELGTPVVLPDNGEEHLDYRSTSTAMEYLRQFKEQGQSFFLALGLFEPHNPPAAPRKFFDRYVPGRMQLPVDFAPRPTVPSGFPKLSVRERNSDLFIGRDASDEEARLVKRGYWAAVSFMDAQVGRILAELDRLDLRDNTVVMFWGDHGYHLGEKGKWSKANSLFEVGTRVPLLISAPGFAGNGRTCDRIVESIDIYPTLADICGLPLPLGIEGKSLTTLLADPGAEWHRPAYSFTVINGAFGRAVRTGRWRYAEWDGGHQGAMLFDHRVDPMELKNVVLDPAHAKTVAGMKTLLARFPDRDR